MGVCLLNGKDEVFVTRSFKNLKSRLSFCLVSSKSLTALARPSVLYLLPVSVGTITKSLARRKEITNMLISGGLTQER